MGQNWNINCSWILTIWQLLYPLPVSMMQIQTLLLINDSGPASVEFAWTNLTPQGSVSFLPVLLLESDIMHWLSQAWSILGTGSSTVIPPGRLSAAVLIASGDPSNTATPCRSLVLRTETSRGVREAERLTIAALEFVSNETRTRCFSAAAAPWENANREIKKTDDIHMSVSFISN